MQVLKSDENAAHDFIHSHATFKQGTHSLTKTEGNLNTMEYYVSKEPRGII